MGRHASYEPYRLKRGNYEFGTYRAWIPGQGPVDLGTADPDEAARLVEGIRNSSGGADTTQVQSEPVEIPSTDSSTDRIELVTNEAPPQRSNPDVTEVLKKWARETAPDITTPHEPSAKITMPADQVRTFTEPKQTTTPLRPITAIAPKKTRGLTPEQSQKISGALKKLVVKINVLGADTMVRLLGRDPCELDDDDLDLLTLGWEMQLEQWLDSAKLKPWQIVLAANILLCSAMYIGGEPIKKGSVTKLESVPPPATETQEPKPAEMSRRPSGLRPPMGPTGG